MNTNAHSIQLSIVAPVFNEELLIEQFVRRTVKACQATEVRSWEIILCDDGSTDQTRAIIGQLRQEIPQLQYVFLSRNFGHQAAITAGLEYASGDAVIIIDADLQDPPEVIPDLVNAYQAGHSVVIAERLSRKETGWRKHAFKIYHRFFGKMLNLELPSETGVFGLLDRVALDHLRSLTERHRFLPGLRAWIGFKTATVHYHRQERAAGTPKQSFIRLLSYALDGLFSFSFLPLRALLFSGIIISFSGFLLALYFAMKRILGLEDAFTGFTTLITLALLLGGIQLISLGVIGEYLGRIYEEVKKRPLFVAEKASIEPQATPSRR